MSAEEIAKTQAMNPAATVVASGPGNRQAPERRERLVVAGFGMTAFKLVERLAALDALKQFAVTLIGEEPYPAYDRVHLTEWLDHGDFQRLALGRADWSQALGVHVLSGDAVTAIDREGRAVRTAAGERVAYDRLVLATGSAPHVPPIEGADSPGVFVYRSLDDIKRIRRRTESVRSAVVVGGGLLGIEAADALCAQGLDVSLLESGAHLMRRQLDSEAAARLEQCIAAKGIRTLKDARALRIESRDGDLVLTIEGREQPLTAGMVVISAGVRPRDEVARQAGLAVAHPGGGIAVNDELRTSDWNIHAIGDCASHGGIAWGLVAPGYRMAETLAGVLAGGRNRFSGYAPAVRLRLAGIDIWSLGDPGQRGVRVGWSDDESYRRITVRGRRILAAAAVGPWEEIGVTQEIIRHGRHPSPPQLQQFIRTGNFTSSAERLPVTAWPASAMVCNCLEVTRGALSAACEQGCASVPALAERTGASTVCGACRPLLSTLVGDASSAPDNAARRGLWAAASAAAVLTLIFALATPISPASSVQNDGIWDTLYRDGWWRQATGFGILGSILVGTAGYSLRKRWKRVTLGGIAWWRLAHGAIGVLALTALIAHTGLRLGSGFNRALMILFLASSVLGAAASVGLGGRHARATFWFHVLAVWPLPAVLGFHILAAYYF